MLHCEHWDLYWKPWTFGRWLFLHWNGNRRGFFCFEGKKTFFFRDWSRWRVFRMNQCIILRWFVTLQSHLLGWNWHVKRGQPDIKKGTTLKQNCRPDDSKLPSVIGDIYGLENRSKMIMKCYISNKWYRDPTTPLLQIYIHNKHFSLFFVFFFCFLTFVLHS